MGFISLGCPKNLVDSEVMMGQFNSKDSQSLSNAQQLKAFRARPPSRHLSGVYWPQKSNDRSGLKNKVVLITGANNPCGIGAAVARAFAAQGARLFLQYLRQPDANPSCNETEPLRTPGLSFYRSNSQNLPIKSSQKCEGLAQKPTRGNAIFPTPQ